MKEKILKEIEEGMRDALPFHKIEELLIQLYELGKADKLKEVENIITPLYDKRDHGFEYWLTGNYDDTFEMEIKIFEMGIKIGERDTLYDLSVELNIDLEEPEDNFE